MTQDEGGQAAGERGETEKERLDRNLRELLEELRVAIPGVQVLFAFLLMVPFNQRFTELSAFEERVYFGTLLCAAGATAFLIAPSAHHRVEFRRGNKSHIVRMANGLALVGLAFLSVAIVGAVLLVTHFIFGTVAAAVVSAALGALFVTLWYVVPAVRRVRQQAS